jgi:hypothetical protein
MELKIDTPAGPLPIPITGRLGSLGAVDLERAWRPILAFNLPSLGMGVQDLLFAFGDHR